MQQKLESLFWFIVDNGPTILTIGFASYVIAISQTTTLSTEVLLQWILAILGLIAVSGLIERLRTIKGIENVGLKTLRAVENRFGERESADTFFMKRLPSIEPYLEKAADVNLCGVALQRTIRENIHMFAQLLKDGANVRLVIVDPNGEAAKRIANPLGNFPLESLKANTEITLHNVKWLESLPEKTGTIEVRFIDEEPRSNIIAIDPDKESGIIFVEIYPQRWSTGSRPRFELNQRRDNYWFNYYREQFDRIWEDSKKTVDAAIVDVT